MKLSINTVTMQAMVMKAMKGASMNKMIPLTGLMAIQLKENKLTLITTDATNYLYVSQDKIDGEDFYVVVNADIFSKLIGKMTCETITMELLENELKVKGNGTYSIEIPLDEDGTMIQYPDPLMQKPIPTEATTDIHLSTIKAILGTCKAALATTLEVPCYTGYYIGENVVATDTYKICGMGVKLFEEPVLISPEFMNLLETFTEEHIDAYRDGDTLVFSSKDCIVYGKELDGIEDYQIDAISGLLANDFGSKCKVNKGDILGVLDRLNLFVNKYDKNAVRLTFTKDGLNISSKKSNGVEVVGYTGSENFKDFTALIDIEMLASQIKANAADEVEIWYGQDSSIKMTSGNITQIVALLED